LYNSRRINATKECLSIISSTCFKSLARVWPVSSDHTNEAPVHVFKAVVMLAWHCRIGSNEFILARVHHSPRWKSQS
jgi:hypothetical protein